MFRAGRATNRNQILFVCRYDISFFPPMINWIELQAQDSEHVKVICMRTVTRSSLPTRLPPNVHLFWMPIGRNRAERVLNAAIFNLRVIRELIRGRTGSVVVSGISMYLVMLAILVLRIPKKFFVEYDRFEPSRKLHRLVDFFFLGQLLKRGFLVIAPNESRIHLLEKYCRGKLDSAVLPNFPRRSEFVEGVKERSFDGRLKLYFHGSFGPQLMPLSLVGAISRVSFVELHMVPIVPDVTGADWYLKKFVQAARDANCESLLHVYQPRDSKSLGQLGQNFDIGIASYDGRVDPEGNFACMWGASNKLIQYLAYGLVPLLHTNEQEILRNLKDYSYVVDILDEDALVKLLESIANNWDQFQRRRINGHMFARENWTFEKAFENIKNLLI